MHAEHNKNIHVKLIIATLTNVVAGFLNDLLLFTSSYRGSI